MARIKNFSRDIFNKWLKRIRDGGFNFLLVLAWRMALS
jgi:hypothetical protein